MPQNAPFNLIQTAWTDHWPLHLTGPLDTMALLTLATDRHSHQSFCST